MLSTDGGRQEDLTKNYWRTWREGYFGDLNHLQKWREETSLDHNHIRHSSFVEPFIGGRWVIDGKHGAEDSRVGCSAFYS